MGFGDERTRLLTALNAAMKEGRPVRHDPRQPPEKNLLAMGLMSYADVFTIVRLAQGPHYKACGEHRDKPHIKDVHALENVRWQGQLWYVKWYFEENQLWFISVHPS